MISEEEHARWLAVYGARRRRREWVSAGLTFGPALVGALYVAYLLLRDHVRW